MTIHWCGTGLSSIPGLRHLIETEGDVVVWNRSVDKAKAAVGDIAKDIRAFDMAALTEATKKGCVVISMLPADMHVPLAKMAISAGAHFVSSSYIAPEMRALDEAARKAGVCVVNEVGLDPGIDHLMAHALMHDYRNSAAFDPKNAHDFISYCGGIPKIPNPFRYKFSWSPLGVLKALRSPSRSIADGEELNVSRPWDAISHYTAPLETPEEFEVYANRDSLPFMAEYGFEADWNVRRFVRGTLRLDGWSEAWAPVFREIETLEGAAGDARLREMSDQFWRENSYEADEPDRVVLCVSLKAEVAGTARWHKTYVMDAWRDARGTAMARLVSTPVALAVKAAITGAVPAGVSAAPHEIGLVRDWMEVVGTLAQSLSVVDHLA